MSALFALVREEQIRERLLGACVMLVGGVLVAI
jgi:hypothetical protein